MKRRRVSETAAALALAVARAGSQAQLARALRVKAPSVAEWVQRGKVPPGRCRDIELLYGVSRYSLRPDVFGHQAA